MRAPLADDNHKIRSAEQAADQLFNARNGDTATYREPLDRLSADSAVRHLGKRFNDLPGAITQALDAARDSGDLVSSDKLQGISEVIQNADDVGASQVRLILRPTDLWVGHDGSRVELRHVLGLAIPWLTTKSSEAASIGRFGIGLMTLRSISNTMEVHCHPFHVRFGEPTVSPIDPPLPPLGLGEVGWTTFRIPFQQGMVGAEELAEWLARWDSSALLFLSSVSKVTLFDTERGPIHELSISRRDAGEVRLHERNSSRKVSRCRVDAGDGRSWVVYTEEVASPAAVVRTRKATEATTPIAIAFPQFSVENGQIHAGLPVARTRLPIFANAQFDPITNRQDFANNEWNNALVPFVANLWSQAALDHFARDPKAAWQAMPLPDVARGDSQSPFIDGLENAIIAEARQQVASQLSLPVPGEGDFRLAELAVEARRLEHIVTMAETATLAGLPAALPFELRDQNGTWRTVLEDWREAGAEIPDEVRVEQALELVGDDTRPAGSTVRLVAAGLAEGLSARLVELPCIIAQDGQRMVPPSGESPMAVAAETTPLGEQLGVVTLLHPEHLREGKAAASVLNWLRTCGALLEVSDNRDVVRRLAIAGKAGHPISTPLTDHQVEALREAFERIDPEELRDLGPKIGRAVAIEAYAYVRKGGKKQRISTTARPAEAYLPRAITKDPDGFPIAAGNSVGIKWISHRYARVLRSPSGREGIGAQRFLRFLGAETAPRPRLHPKLKPRFDNDFRRGLPASVASGPRIRSEAMRDRTATYTLQDRDCPTLAVVIQDISRMRRKKARRKRAGALLTTLSRAWARLYGKFSEVESAHDFYVWQDRGRIPAYWLWVARDIAWLDDESGTPRRPIELRVKTTGNVAIYGLDSPDYLHPSLYNPNLIAVLESLGVTGDPSHAQLVTRLKGLRDSENEGQWTLEEVQRETAVLYKALAHLLTSPEGRTRSPVEQLRRDFEHGGGLIFTDLGWLPPRGVLAGPPIFGRYKAFAPAVADTDSLWRSLKIREPSLDDCIDVIRAVARKRGTPDPDDEAVLLQTMRTLATHAETGVTAPVRAKLRKLPLWTSMGWMRDRPVYATGDPILAAGLRSQLPLWEPGGEPRQFASLLNPLRVEEIQTRSAAVVEPNLATEQEDLSELFELSIQHLQEDLVRNDPLLAESISVPWHLVQDFKVYVHPSLLLAVTARRGGADVVFHCNVMAKVDRDRRMVFVQSPGELSRVDSGGRAVATLFDEGDPRLVALAWRAACDRGESGRQARSIELAEERSKRNKDEMESAISARTTDFQERIYAKKQRQDSSRGLGRTSSESSEGTEQRETQPRFESTRILVNPEALDIVNPKGRLETSGQRTARKTGSAGDLVEPKPSVRGPRGTSPLRLYTDLEKEDVGMALLRKLLSSDVEEIADIRAQHGVGADAVDKLKHFYELKVSAGAERDKVTMTAAEVKRARTTPDFFLVVISGIEGADAQPMARVIVDPLSQLEPVEGGSIKLSGVRNATSLTYYFAHIDESAPSSEEE